uniref:Uncharacterized LOC103145668 n=1 Tax=Poecilia formosa TaxID=48698 RepID=A0A096M640_POEFO
KMPHWRKCVLGCEGDYPLFTLPKDDSIRQKWLDFIFGDFPPPKKNWYICARHFTDDSFLNKGLFDKGLIGRLSLLDHAIPTRLKPFEWGQVSETTTHIVLLLCFGKMFRLVLFSIIGAEAHYRFLPCTQGTPVSRSVGTSCVVEMKSQGTSTTPQTAEIGIQCMLLTPTLDDQDSNGPESDEEPETDEEDPDWAPGTEESEDEDLNTTNCCSDLDDVAETCPAAERKFIVFESCLRTLFAVCAVCSGGCTVTMKQIMGTMVAVSSVCKRTDGHTRVWYSQPAHNSMPVGNLMMAAATLFSGCSPTIALNLFRHMSVGIYSLKTFFSLQRSYLIPAIQRVWNTKQQAMIMKKKGTPLRLGGDARCCSSGHTTKYGSYSLMDMNTGAVLTTHLVECNEVQSSAAVELEGLKQGLCFLEQHGLTVAELVTDRHVQVCKWLKTEKPNIDQRFDVWHVSKGIFKKLVAVAKKPGCASVGLWAQAISNHLCWTAATSGGDADMAVQKWTSVARHVCNIHEGHGDLFPRCEHGQSLHKTPNVCMSTGSRAQEEIQAVVLSSRLLADVRQLSPPEQTSYLQSFHNVVCFFGSKHGHFLRSSLEARLILAALHFNENMAKEQARKQDRAQR